MIQHGIEPLSPAEIERRSMAIIERELGARAARFSPAELLVVKRVIHATADFSFADSLAFSPRAVEQGLQALRAGAGIVTDTNMAAAGVNRRVLVSLGGELYCFMAQEETACLARERGVTRAAVSMERAAALQRPLIYAVGNAPTALIRLYELVQAGQATPALVIGVPVGFVHVQEAKELIRRLPIPFIVASGRRGGSGVAAAICNALLYQLGNRS